MAVDQSSRLLDITGTYVNRRLMEQSWFRANANTVTTVAGFLATVVAWAASQPFAVEPGWQAGIFIAGFALTALGVKNTKNGFSTSQVAAINEERARVIGQEPLIAGADEDAPVGEDLEAQVEEFNKARGG